MIQYQTLFYNMKTLLQIARALPTHPMGRSVSWALETVTSTRQNVDYLVLI